MRIAERLGGAVAAGLVLASLMAQAEALAASGNGEAVRAQLERICATLAEDAAAFGFPGQELIRIVAEYRVEMLHLAHRR